MGELARGNLDTHVPNADQKDEIGKFAEAMTTFKNQLAAAEAAKAEQTRVIVSSIGTGLDHLAKGVRDPDGNIISFVQYPPPATVAEPRDTAST
jgi:hypothetical protein